MTIEIHDQSLTQTQIPTPKQSRVLVTGSREWTDMKCHRARLWTPRWRWQVPVTMQDTVILRHGAAKGLDDMAAQVAGGRGWKVEGHPARWILAVPDHVGHPAGTDEGGHR
ncbi:SLOG family protein [Arthrobacter sp. ISL-28]|uniref:SLOG family protein n=1 Tax=Arthrobacter sp. ISL-28 TaxID=2819108 RepID=UPI001BE6DD6B|nr:SLOG family protein [Arthrobacter sp. ISL-28]MBT2521856.1 DUF2493 domain-containing protein [Arthrobacter sp. ISL-28]